jgi:cobalt-zinc-cadmium efflux system protein
METRRKDSHLRNLPSQTTARLAASLFITLIFMLGEAIAGFWANSLVLLTDAAHNLTDVIALALSWYALRMTARPASTAKTFGYHRVGILVALVNSTTLVLIVLGIFYQAYQRLLSPPRVEVSILIVVALIAFVVNLGTAWLVKRGSERDLNLRSAFVHLAGDALSSMAAILAGVGIALTGMRWLDPLVSIFIGLLILWNAWGIIHETVEILLESTPRNVDIGELVRDLLLIKGVRGVHDLHVWSITQNMRALSAHVLTDNISISAGASIQRGINEMLFRKYGVAHAVLQLECEGCEPNSLYCDLAARDGNHRRDSRKEAT